MNSEAAYHEEVRWYGSYMSVYKGTLIPGSEDLYSIRNNLASFATSRSYNNPVRALPH